jgi:hypothetical protein
MVTAAETGLVLVVAAAIGLWFFGSDIVSRITTAFTRGRMLTVGGFTMGLAAGGTIFKFLAGVATGVSAFIGALGVSNLAGITSLSLMQIVSVVVIAVALIALAKGGDAVDD